MIKYKNLKVQHIQQVKIYTNEIYAVVCDVVLNSRTPDKIWIKFFVMLKVECEKKIKVQVTGQRELSFFTFSMYKWIGLAFLHNFFKGVRAL